MKKKPAWFSRETPREWGRGNIAVDGDDTPVALKYVGQVIAVIAVAWVFVALVFCVTGK